MFFKGVVVEIFSDCNFLSLSILEQLLSKHCEIVLYTRDKERWEESLSHANYQQRLRIVSSQKEEKGTPGTYCIFVHLGKKNFERILKQAQERSLDGTKTFFITDWVNYTPPADSVESHFLAKVFVGDLFGPRMDLGQQKALGDFIKAMNIGGKGLEVSKGDAIYPTYAPDFSRQVASWLFSFGPYGESVFVHSGRYSSWELYLLLKEKFEGAKVSYKTSDKTRTEAQGKYNLRNLKAYQLNTNIPRAVEDTLAWMKHNSLYPVDSGSPRRIKFSERKNRGFWITLTILFAALLFPAVTMLVAGAMTFFSLRSLERLDLKKAGILSEGAKTTSSVSKTSADVLENIPLLGIAYKEQKNISNILIRTNSLVLRSLELFDTASEWMGSILGDRVYETRTYSSAVEVDLDNIYNELSFLESEILQSSDFVRGVFARHLKEPGFERVKTLLLYTKGLVGESESLLGAESPKTYLVLLQNNMELRPAGGFIGSFALVSFDGGRLVDISVSDVYSADGQLKGYVEPPAPIRDYLGEASWFLRDSNWDPDFPTSAKRAEWFLDKEINKAVDGVIAVDLELVKNILKETGPVYLADFSQEINSSNLYERTQYEVESEFFPGSHKKATFLTALTRELLRIVSEAKSGDYIKVAKAFYTGLEERSVQAYIHSPSAQQALSRLGWDGSAAIPVCESQGCYWDWMGLVEANVGVNKANYFIERKMHLSVEIDPTAISRKLDVTILNNANPGLGEGGRYKGYFRVMAPAYSEFGSVLVSEGSSPERITPEVSVVGGRKEAGVLVEITPGASKTISFSWTSKHDFSGEKGEEIEQYRLFWRKQAGTKADEVSVGIINPSKSPTSVYPEFVLTEAGGVGYNTLLSRDFVSRIFWK